MPIRFACSCGRVVQADDVQAGQAMLCSGCRRTLEIPPFSLADLFAFEHSPQIPTLLARARTQFQHKLFLKPWPLESSWQECLIYPLRNFGWVLGLALGGSIIIPLIHFFTREEPLALIPCFVILLCLAGGIFSCLDAILCSGLAGDSQNLSWPKIPMARAALALVLFLAGPAVPFTVALIFWIHAGNLTWIDKMILVELFLLAFAWWFLSWVSTRVVHEMRATPQAIVRLIRALGVPPVTAALLAAAIVLSHGLLILSTLHGIQEEFFLSWFLLLALGTSALFWLFFVTRWLGVACFHLQGKKWADGK